MTVHLPRTLFLLFLFFFQNQLIAETAVRLGSHYGFFADFLYTLNHLEFCIAHGKTPVVCWGNDSSYFSPDGYNGSKNAWEYYFEPVSGAVLRKGDQFYRQNYYPRSNNFSTLWWYCQYIDNKYKLSPEEQRAFKPVADHEKIYLSEKFDYQRAQKYPVGQYHLYDPVFRKMVKEQIIDRFIHIKPVIQKRIQDFYVTHMAGKKTIGIHLRGNFLYGEVLPVPLEAIFAEANQYADLGYQFFIATDQYPLIDEAKKNLRGKVLFCECQRFEKTTSPDGSFKLAPQLGEDILVEMFLLSQTDHLIHTISNVSTAALYFNPKLSHTVLY